MLLGVIGIEYDTTQVLAHHREQKQVWTWGRGVLRT